MYLTSPPRLCVDVGTDAKAAHGVQSSPPRVTRSSISLGTLIHIVGSGLATPAEGQPLSPHPPIDLGLEADVHA
jgi:hypothetical protein